MNSESHQHYDESYFEWQRPMGEFGGWANVTKFSPYVQPSDRVLDFGCGGGFLLKSLECQSRVGVEVNEAARQVAEKGGIEVHQSLSSVPDQSVDIAISNHALEHVRNPFEQLVILRQKLRPGGLAVFVVPCESITNPYDPSDVNQHLYTWSPLNLGNLFTAAGFRVKECRALFHKWPPFYRQIAKIGGRAFFEIACRVFGHVARKNFQVKVVAEV